MFVKVQTENAPGCCPLPPPFGPTLLPFNLSEFGSLGGTTDDDVFGASLVAPEVLVDNDNVFWSGPVLFFVTSKPPVIKHIQVTGPLVGGDPGLVVAIVPGDPPSVPVSPREKVFDFTLKTCVDIDIKPQSCPNPLNTRDRGTLPVAILGTAAFSVTDINVSTIQLLGMPALRSAFEDVARPFSGSKRDCLDCTTEGADGQLDLTLHFDAQAIVAALGPVTDRQCLRLKLTGQLNNGAEFQGSDIVRIQTR